MNLKPALVLLSLLSAPLTAAADTGSAAEDYRVERLVSFEPGKRRIYSNGRENIRLVAHAVRATCPTAKVTVEGNAYFADEEDSIALGQARADVVRGLLIKSGFAPSAVDAVGYARNTLAEGNGRFVDLVIECK